MISRIRIFFKKTKKATFLKIFAFLILVSTVGFLFYKDESLKPANPSFDLNRGFVSGEKNVPKKIKVRNFSISIPAINVKAPVIPNVSGVEKEYLKALQGGVVHFKGSFFPGQGGNIVIFGHSSYYQDRPGNYKTIFRNLENLQKGNLIRLNFNHKEYLYQVQRLSVVDPDSVKYMRPTAKERLTLITCVPPGTTKYRLIVLAEPKRD